MIYYNFKNFIDHSITNTMGAEGIEEMTQKKSRSLWNGNG